MGAFFYLCVMALTFFFGCSFPISRCCSFTFSKTPDNLFLRPCSCNLFGMPHLFAFPTHRTRLEHTMVFNRQTFYFSLRTPKSKNACDECSHFCFIPAHSYLFPLLFKSR